MRHLKVEDSDIIEAIGYEMQAVLKSGVTGAMEVVFKASPDTVYRYDDIDADVFIQLVSAESIGKEFHRMIKAPKVPFTKSERKPTLKKGG